MFTALLCIASFLAGCAFLAAIYDRKINQLTDDNARLAGQVYTAKMNAQCWHENAIAIASDMQKMRKEHQQDRLAHG